MADPAPDAPTGGAALGPAPLGPAPLGPAPLGPAPIVPGDPTGLADLAPAPLAPRTTATRTVDLDGRTIVVAMAALLGMFAVFGVVRSTGQTLTWVVIGTLLALALNPLVSTIERRLRVRRGGAVGLVVAGLLGLAALIGFVLGPPAIQEARRLSDDLPDVVADLGDLPVIGPRLREADAPARVEQWLEDLPERLGADTSPLANAGRAVLSGAAAAFATLLVTIVLLLDGERLVRTARRALPLRLRARADRVGGVLYQVVGRYFAGSVLVAMMAGTAVLLAGLALGVPLAPLAAVWVTCTNLIPQIGGAAGAIPFVALGFSEGAGTGLACLAFFMAYQQFENHVLQPIVIGQAVDLSPPATMVAALIGVSAAGVPGALVAVPLIGAAKAVYLELRPPAGPSAPRAANAPGGRRTRR